MSYPFERTINASTKPIEDKLIGWLKSRSKLVKCLISSFVALFLLVLVCWRFIHSDTSQVVPPKAINNPSINLGLINHNQSYFVEEATSNNEAPILDNTGCLTRWSSFSTNEWQGLNANFLNINSNLYTLPTPGKGVDAVAFYSKPCTSGFVAEFKVVPYSQSLMNLNLYYESWFRWEIGGNDMRSVKLYKNSQGCTAMKNVRKVKIQDEFLPEHDEIMPEKPVSITFSVFPTESGNLKTKIDLTYTSTLTKEKVIIAGRFQHEFEMNWSCDENTVLDINKDSYRIGIGLQKSSVKGREIPKISFDEFRISHFKQED